MLFIRPPKPEACSEAVRAKIYVQNSSSEWEPNTITFH